MIPQVFRMSNTIPCPNPVCTHSFTQVELQSAAQLVCPLCGFRMQGKAKAAPKPVPTAKPAVAQPIPVATAKVVVASPVAAAPKPAPASPTPSVGSEETVPDETLIQTPLVRTGKRSRPFNWTKLALILLATGFAISIVVGAGGLALLLFNRGGGLGGPTFGSDDVVHTGAIRDSKGASEKVYQLVLSKAEWSLDNEVKSKLGAHTAWKHNELDFWFALVVKDHASQKPRDAEMLQFALSKLENQFGDALELGAKAEPAKFDGLPAQKIQFKGQIKTSNWLGECYMFFKDGIAYYCYLGSPDWETVQKYAASLPERHFNVMVERRGWREQPPPMETFTSLNTKLALTVPKKVWERANPKDIDENGELFLFGRFQKDNEKDNRKNASILVFTMPAKDDGKDAVKAARDYLDSKVMNDMTNFKIVHAAEVSAGQSELGADEEVGNRKGRIVDLKLVFNAEAKRYYLMAVLTESEQTFVILCECAWESRQIWRQDFLEVLRSLHVKKSE
jgi:hypothetical protein